MQAEHPASLARDMYSKVLQGTFNLSDSCAIESEECFRNIRLESRTSRPIRNSGSAPGEFRLFRQSRQTRASRCNISDAVSLLLIVRP